ncbi:MAG: thioredoxin [Betaproteobacteria bacterium]|nr:thioredoxin [Betaproteobacteria bacterium]
MSSHSIEVNEASFRQEVVQASFAQPVLVDFWAPWCGPCRALTPILDRLAEEYGGRVRLAKVNSDENPGLSMEFGVRSIPSVKAFVDGVVVDEFLGAQPESAVRAFIERLLPDEGEILRRRAVGIIDKGEEAAAVPLLEQAIAADPKNDRARVDLAEALHTLGQDDAAREALATLTPLAGKDRDLAPRIARLNLALSVSSDADTSALRDAVSGNPDDLAARLKLANALVANREYEAGLDELLEIIRRDRAFDDDAGRRTMLQVFDLLGPDDPLVPKYRRLLASTLH